MAPLRFRVVLPAIAAMWQLPARRFKRRQNPTYPNQTVRLVVPFSAGSVTDLLARSIGDKLGEPGASR